MVLSLQLGFRGEHYSLSHGHRVIATFGIMTLSIGTISISLFGIKTLINISSYTWHNDAQHNFTWHKDT
jgi:hypothetical protein